MSYFHVSTLYYYFYPVSADSYASYSGIGITMSLCLLLHNLINSLVDVHDITQPLNDWCGPAKA